MDVFEWTIFGDHFSPRGGTGAVECSERRFCLVDAKLWAYFYHLTWQLVLLRDSLTGLINWFSQRSRNPCEHQRFCSYKAELWRAGCALCCGLGWFLTVEKPRSC